MLALEPKNPDLVASPNRARRILLLNIILNLGYHLLIFFLSQRFELSSRLRFVISMPFLEKTVRKRSQARTKENMLAECLTRSIDDGALRRFFDNPEFPEDSPNIFIPIVSIITASS